jgi:membrane-bound ClpP family serine protease
MFWLLVIGIVFIGLVFILAEILFVPGGILGIVGGLLLFYAIYLPYGAGYGIEAHINVIAILVALSLSLFLMVRSNTWNRIKLSKSIDSTVAKNVSDSINIGDIGICVSRLVPMGKARFGDIHAEVKSYSTFVDQGTEIEVVEIKNDKIIVKPLKN